MKKTLILFFLLGVSGFQMAQDLAQWRGDNRDGIYNETNLLKSWPETGPKMLWHFDELGDGHASAAVTSKMIYSAGMIEEMDMFCTKP